MICTAAIQVLFCRHPPQVMPDPGAPGGAVRGRWRIQPPCGQVGPLDGNSVFTNNNKGCVPPAAGCASPGVPNPSRLSWQLRLCAPQSSHWLLMVDTDSTAHGPLVRSVTAPDQHAAH